MTNKIHKRTTNSKKVKATKSKEENASPSVDTSVPKAKPFTNLSQVAALIYLTIGYSKIMEFSVAISEGTEDPQKCMSYLNDEETCSNPGFTSLIKVKYYSGISLMAIVTTMVLQLWKSEEPFSKLMSCLCLSPLSTTAIIASTVSMNFVSREKVWQLVMNCAVLAATCFPSSTAQMPFVTDKPWTARSAQSVCLITLALACVWDVLRVMISEHGMQNALLATSSPLPEPARALMHYWIVDKISMALLFTFAVVHLPRQSQRVSLNFMSLVQVKTYNLINYSVLH